ncbi:hypothetical protein B566_EDAN016571 [Ephemera danica]|nr:hypothetical protein B566_EDAN016571 [Ephemera danica]
MGGRHSTPATAPRRSTAAAMSSSRSHATSTAAATASAASHSHHSSSRKHRSRSSQRFQDLEKPKKKKYLTSGSTSLVSIPNTIKLSMLNSGLISIAAIPGKPGPRTESEPIGLLPVGHVCCIDQREKNSQVTLCDVTIGDYARLEQKSDVEHDDSRVEVTTNIWGSGSAKMLMEAVVLYGRIISEQYGVMSTLPTKPVEIKNFVKQCDQRRKFPVLFKVEFQTACKVETHSCRHATKSANKEKNQNQKCVPYDYNRVVLEPQEDTPDSDYINASYVDVSSSCTELIFIIDGGGRSGVYLAMDANMELMEEEDAFDVFGYLKKLRQSRKGLIETLDQYKFVYDTLEEFVVCGNSWFPVSELSARLRQKSVKNHVTKLNDYQREYQQICKQTPRFTIGDCAGGHRGDNREKNRDVLIVPPDNFRPYLTSFQGNNFTDYINAVFVDGYTKPREYIVTEWPVVKTLGEFWSLAYDYECSAIVVLCTHPKNSQGFPPFWPEGRKSVKYGPVFTIEPISHQHYTNIKSWLFQIQKKLAATETRSSGNKPMKKPRHTSDKEIVSLTELMAGVKAPPRKVQLYQLMCWPAGHKVPTSTNSLVELMNMVERWRQRTDYGPVVVVSADGRGRCGVYCSANACIEQVIQHGEVDIFQAVKTVRRHRPQLVENMTEYKYCYDLVLHYVLHYLHKVVKEKEKK